jgi:hypothetical protein
MQTTNILYSTLAVPSSETCTLEEKFKSGITAAGLKILMKTAKYTLFGHRRNQDIVKELNYTTTFGKIYNKNKNIWL